MSYRIQYRSMRRDDSVKYMYIYKHWIQQEEEDVNIVSFELTSGPLIARSRYLVAVDVVHNFISCRFKPFEFVG